MADIIHRIGIKSSAEKVYRALATVEGVAGWWTQETTGTSKVGGRMDFRFLNDDGSAKGEMGMEVTALDPNKSVRWAVKSGPPEWIGTEITFEVRQEGDMTIVLFGHRNWREPVEFMAHCSMKWATFLLSLRSLVETGQGHPAPRDLKIDNWN